MARSDRYNQNLSKVQDMLDGNNQGKIQVGYTPDNVSHKVGDIWTDSDGVQWEQKNGYRSKITKTANVGIFSRQCKDCKKGCTKVWDTATVDKSGRCYYCQLDFEVMLKSKPIGKNGNKWEFWVRLQELSKWISGRNELEAFIFQQHEERKMTYDMSVANAMTNANVSMEIKKNS